MFPHGVATSRKLHSVLLVAIVLLSGCSAFSGGGIVGPTATISNPHAAILSEETPAIVFNYSVGDYADVLLEGPRGRVIAEDKLEPSKSVDALAFRDPQPGEYKLIIQQGGETIREQTVTFNGPAVTTAGMNVTWSGNRLNTASVTLRNNGDLPVRVQNATIEARDQSVSSGALYKWVPPGDTATVNITPSFSQTIAISTKGDVSGEVNLHTSNGTVTASFSEQFAGPTLQITSATAQWDGNELLSIQAKVENTGDLPTEITTHAERAGETLVESDTRRLGPGQNTEIELSKLGGLWTAQSGGNKDVTVVVDSGEGFVTETLTHRVAPANLSLTILSPSWDGNALSQVDYTVRNEGDVGTQFGVNLLVDGATVANWTEQIGAHTTREFGYAEAFGSLYTTQDGGTHEVTLQVTTGSQTDSISESQEIAPLSLAISSYTPEWENGELAAVRFTLKNTGDIGSDITSTLTVNGETIKTVDSEIGPATKGKYIFEPSDYDGVLYRALKGGTADVEVEVAAGDERVSATESTTFTGPQATLSEVDASFLSNYDSSTSDLIGVEFTVKNTGDVVLPYDTVRVTLDEATRTDELLATESVKPGETKWTLLSVDDISVKNGEHEMKVKFLLDGTVVAADTVTVSTG